MERTIAVFTGTRAEYGALFWLMRDIEAHQSLQLQILVSGSHMSPEFGMTIKQIERDGFKIAEKVEMLLSSDSTVGLCKSLGVGIIGYADAMQRLNPDIMVVLGDRYEALGIAQVCMLMGIPVFHLHGGERTDGAFDDSIRHAITKFSTYHGTSNEQHRQRVIQLGESPDRVWDVGAVGLEHVFRTPLLSREELSQDLGFDLSKSYFLVTYHPVTLMEENETLTFSTMMDALLAMQDHRIILTYPNADDGGREIISEIHKLVEKYPQRIYATKSLGQLRYLSALKYASAMVGNSSSGIVEAPAMRTATVNIGNRQKGRLHAESVVQCGTSFDEITKAVCKAVSEPFKSKLATIVNPYGKDDTSKRIVSLLNSVDLDVKKTFIDYSPH